MEAKRLFIAVNLPASVKEKIFTTYSQILNPKLFKPVEKENLHFTLKFLGNFPSEKIPELCKSLKLVSREKFFEVSMQGFGSFGKNILWIGVSKAAGKCKS